MAKNETKKAKIETLAMEMISTESLSGFSMLNYLPNPDPILKAQGGRLQVYRDMRDAHLRSVRRKRRAGVSSKPWSLQSGNGDYDKAKLVETCLWNMNLRNPIIATMGAVDYGYQVTEVVWEVADGLWLPVALKDKPQELFRFSKKSELIFTNEKNGILPPHKFLLTQCDSSALNPYGEPTLADCFWPLAFKKGGLKFWMLFAEKFGLPKMVGKVPGGSTTEEKAEFLKQIYSLVRDASMVINDSCSVDSIETKTSGLTPFESLVRWADREISKAYLGETLTTEQTDTGGTRALGEVHNEVRGELTQDDLAMVEGTMNTLIKWIWKLNWAEDKEIPWFQFAQPKDMQMGQIARDKEIHGMGVEFTPEYFSDTYGINIKYIAGIRSGQQGSMFAEGEAKAKPKAKGSQRKAELAAKEIIKEISENDFQEQIEEMAKPIIALCEECGSYEEFEQALLNIAPNIKSNKLEEAITKCMMIAEAKGALNV